MNKNTDLVLFGAKGDLSARKLFPALYHLHYCGLLDNELRIVALAREDLTTEAFLEEIKPKMASYVNSKRWTEKHWDSFAKRFLYLSMNFAEADSYASLADVLDEQRTSIFYLATPPQLFDNICEHLGNSGCLTKSSRIVLEKPIGHDLQSCIEVNQTVANYFQEENIYRIDHYLGKETVQNLLVLRFANRFINTQWDQSSIDHVQITVAETVGIEGRWSYYDKVGQLRDMVQNHLMQLLCLVAMEPPNSMTADGIRDEKVKILRALRTIDSSSVAEHAVRGQYSDGWYRGQAVPGYLGEEGCEHTRSDTETFVAIKAHVDNWRWAGVPFYLRTGKRMHEKITEIVITFKSLPHNIFSSGENIPNRLVIRLQPNEGIEMQMSSKLHSLKDKMALVKQNLNLDFLGTSGNDRIPDAYERLFLDAIKGDQSLFVGREEVEESWRWCDALIKAWNEQALEVKSYHAGSWGPTKADLLIERDGRSWHE
ncbi:MAG: glucose-6-phosphate dehydrogenase [Gammaproteobacteria bacterium]|uniref:glucose-6-phosphate dehydrogenase n=1 Tax=Pseudomaricurvus alcaniphilus TaxID=1166482 RepID=UPI0014073FBB|nr:glucose-6-phosphate dehydrogenase [Pseudomaricurvus alcaniphilus]MBR9912248.1 glucose-6-phosphate dehydrogenase [Gammaproteobacteria bacterium]NHN37375.1 glucose-6-phosphate dehydrogenase [Pseudomaricurvus alcaniphilus]